MKKTDDYKAKVHFWAESPRVQTLPQCQLPRFSPKKFSTHEEMNQWKRTLLMQIAREYASNG